MNWTNISADYQEENNVPSLAETKHSTYSIHQQNEQKRSVQLDKLSNHKHAEQKRAYIDKTNKFGELLTTNNIKDLAKDLMTEDCEVVLINFAEMSPVLECVYNHLEFINLLKDYRMTQREVKETYVDLVKTTVIQICSCKIMNDKDDSLIIQYSCEIFSFEDHKISRYRASFGWMSEQHDPESLFIPSIKEQMLAKVKELNYAWVDQPDFEKIASLLHECTEYKLWRCKDKKGFTFHKHNLASEFRRAFEEEDFEIKSIVPFDPSCEAQFIVGSYVYYLEGKGGLEGRKYQWINTCIYAFDRDLNIVKINQQGELYPEDGVIIPFEAHSKDKIKKKIDSFYAFVKDQNVSLFSSQEMNFSFDIWIFSSSQAFYTGVIKGFNEYKKLAEISALKCGNFELAKPIDLYVDFDDPIYDTAITFDCTKGVLDRKGTAEDGKTINIYGMRKFSFENGKIAKIVMIIFGVVEYDPSLSGHINSPDFDKKNNQKFI